MLINFAGHQLIFDGLGALFWPAENTLVIADLHLEKGSYYASSGNPIPLYDTFDTLKKLERLINVYQPHTMISLGDNIHDINAFVRMSSENHSLLSSLIKSVEQWIWILGNHDQKTLPLQREQIYFYNHYVLTNITFSHELSAEAPFQIVGHYHPKSTVQSMSGKCFLKNESKIIMPSFGSYTGGLNVGSVDFKQATNHESFQAYFIYREKVWWIR